jgi:hypothetical protein
MPAASHPIELGYAIGDEVVVRLSGVAVLRLDSGETACADCLPEWTIGTVVGRTARGGVRYAVRFGHEGTRCLCNVPAAAIDGRA